MEGQRASQFLTRWLPFRFGLDASITVTATSAELRWHRLCVTLERRFQKMFGTKKLLDPMHFAR